MNRGGLTTTLVFYESKKYGKFGALKKSSSLTITEANTAALFSRCKDYDLSPAPQRPTTGQGERQRGLRSELVSNSRSARALACCSPFSPKCKAQQPNIVRLCFFPGQSGAGAVRWGNGVSPALVLLPNKTRKAAGRLYNRCILLLRFYNVLKSGGTRKINHIILPQDINRHSYNC